MSESYRVRIAEHAAEQIAEAKRWWRDNRTKAPGAVDAELKRAIEVLQLQPNVGAKSEDLELANVRRMHLGRIRYHLYYQIRPEGRTVLLLALWHSSHEDVPQLDSDPG